MKCRVMWALNRRRQDLEEPLGIDVKMSTFTAILKELDRTGFGIS